MGTLVFQANLGGAVNLVGPNTASTVNFTLPSADGTANQALVTNGTGTLSFATVAGTPGGSNTQVQFNNSGAFGGSANLTYNGTALNLKGTLLLSGSSSGSVGFAPAAAAGSTTYTLPAADGTNGQSLTTNGAGTLSWASSGGGGFSGATTNAISSSAITLTSSSSQYQVCQISSFTNSYVTLPDATTMTAGSNPFVIENRSPFGANLELRNSAGTTVGYIPIGQIGTVQLTDKSTSAGRWNVELVNPQVFFTYNSASITNTTTSPLPYTSSAYGLVGLSSTSFVRWWIGTSGNGTSSTIVILYTQAATISGSTITFGSIQSSNIIAALDTTAGAVNLATARVIRLSNTAFVVLVGEQNYTNNCSGINYTGQQRILVCTVSGTTVTFGTPSAASMPSYSNITATNNTHQTLAVAVNGTICRLSDTVFALFYNDAANLTYSFPYNYSGSMACQIVSVSGTTMTIGTKVQLSTSTYSQVLSAVALSSTSVFLCYGQATGAGGTVGRSKIIVVSVSGTVPTFNTPVSCESSDVACFNSTFQYSTCPSDGAVAPSASQVIFNSAYATGECSISGTVPTFDVFAYSATTYPLFLSTSSKAWSSSRYLSIATGGFVTNTNAVNVLQTNLSVTNAIPLSPLGAQPTTSFISYGSANTGASASSTVVIGTTT